MKKLLILIGLCMVFQTNISAFSGIVFWEYSKNDSYNIIVKKSYNDLLKDKTKSVFLPFEKCLKYDNRNLEFYYTKEEMLNPEIVLTEWTIGNRYFSIVIDNKIILTGLNRVGYYGANMLQEDCNGRVYLCSIGLDVIRFKLTTDYIYCVFPDFDQDADKKKIKYKKIDDYFLDKRNIR